MALATYGNLKASIASWLKRSDLTTQIPDFIALAEADIRRDVRMRAMEAQATGTLVAQTLALPTRFAEARQITLGGTVQEYLTPQQWTPFEDSSNNRYTIIGENLHFQSSSSDYVIDYWQWFAAFTDDADTNSLLTSYPDVYLGASMAWAMVYTQGDPSSWRGIYKSAVAGIRSAEARGSHPGTLSVRTYGVIA